MHVLSKWETFVLLPTYLPPLLQSLPMDLLLVTTLEDDSDETKAMMEEYH